MVKEVKAPVKTPTKAKAIKLDTDKAINKIYELEREVLELRTSLGATERKAATTYKALVSERMKLDGTLKSIQDIFDNQRASITALEKGMESHIRQFNPIEAKCNSLEKFSTSVDKELRERMMALEHTMKSLFNYKNFLTSSNPEAADEASNNFSNCFVKFTRVCSIISTLTESKYGVDSFELKRIQLCICELNSMIAGLDPYDVD